jgi:hypothetical protein
MARVGNTVESRTEMLVREILVFGTRYMTGVTNHWNDIRPCVGVRRPHIIGWPSWTSPPKVAHLAGSGLSGKSGRS